MPEVEFYPGRVPFDNDGNMQDVPCANLVGYVHPETGCIFVSGEDYAVLDDKGITHPYKDDDTRQQMRSAQPIMMEPEWRQAYDFAAVLTYRSENTGAFSKRQVFYFSDSKGKLYPILEQHYYDLVRRVGEAAVRNGVWGMWAFVRIGDSFGIKLRRKLS